MAKVFVSIGSNIEREHYIAASLDSLSAEFGRLQISSVYESEAVGFEGDNFYNLVAAFETNLSVAELSQFLKRTEDEHGRCRKGPRFSGRTLDIDILTYDDLVGDCGGVELPRDEITKNAFVLWPLAEIAGDLLHPQLQQSYQSLWQGYDRASQKIWTVSFAWQGYSLPILV